MKNILLRAFIYIGLFFFSIQSSFGIDGKISSSNNAYKIKIISASLDSFPNVQLVFKLQDNTRRPVWNLNLNDIDVSENGSKCKKNYLRGLSSQTVLKINLIIDKSTSMLLDENLQVNEFGQIIYYNPKLYNPPINYAKNAAVEFVEKFKNSNELFALTAFSNNVEILSNFTKNKKSIIEKIKKIEATGATTLYDVISGSVSEDENDTLNVNVLLTDGEDTYSKTSFDSALYKVKKSKSIFYIIGLGNVDSSKLIQFANSSNGEYYSLQNPQFLNTIYNKIYENIASYYVVDFSSNSLIATDSTFEYQINFTSASQNYFDKIKLDIPENVKNYILAKQQNTYIIYGLLFAIAIGTTVVIYKKKRKTYNV